MIRNNSNKYWKIIKLYTVLYYILGASFLIVSGVDGVNTALKAIIRITFIPLLMIGFLPYPWLIKKDLSELSKNYKKSYGRFWFVLALIWIMTYPILPIAYITYRLVISEKVSSWQNSFSEDVDEIFAGAELKFEQGEYQASISQAKNALDATNFGQNIEKKSELGNLEHDIHARFIKFGEKICTEKMSNARKAVDNGEFDEAVKIAKESQTLAKKVLEYHDTFKMSEQIPTSQIEKTRKEAENKHAEWKQQRIVNKIENNSSYYQKKLVEATELAKNKDFQNAIDIANEIRDRVSDIEQSANKLEDFNSDLLQEIEEIHDKVENKHTDWERKNLVSQIKNISSIASEGYDSAEAEFGKILTTLSNTDSVSDQELELLKKEAQIEYAEAIKKIAFSSYGVGQKYIESGKYEAAIEAFESEVSNIRTAITTIQKIDIENNKIRQVKKEVSDLYLTAHSEAIEARIKIGISQFEKEQYQDAAKSFDKSITRMKSVEKQNFAHSSDSRIQNLKEVAETNADAARRAALGVDDVIPKISEIGRSESSNDSSELKNKRTDLSHDGKWSIQKLQSIDPMEFEELVATLFNSIGYETSVTSGSHDYGVDVWAENGLEKVAIQAKRYSDGNTVGREVIQKLESKLARGDADRVIVITTSTFANTATSYASGSNNVKLINGSDMISMLSDQEIPVSSR